MIFDLGGESLVRIPTLEPLRGTKAHVGKLLDSARYRTRNWSISSPPDRRFGRSPEHDVGVASVGLRVRAGASRVCVQRQHEEVACMAQEQTKRSGGGGEDDGRPGERRRPVRSVARSSREDTDDLLDEIDDVLEENAEDFVRAYVQKGGQ